MENLLHILKLIKQTKCEKQAKLPSTLQSRYTQTHTDTNTLKLNTQAHAEMQTLNNRKKITSDGEKHTYTRNRTHVHSLIYTVITSCGSQRAAGTGRWRTKRRYEKEGAKEDDDDDEKSSSSHICTTTHTHTHALTPEGDSGGSWRVGDGQERKQENRKVQEGRIENETGSQSMHY